MTVKLPGKRELDRLKLSPEVAWYLLDRGYELPNCPPLYKTPEPRDVPGAWFDPERIDRVVDVFRRLRHTKGKWAGRPITLRSWQIAYLIGPTYGWVKPTSDGRPVRIVQTQYLDIPRKNAKTTIGGGQCIYLTCADGEQGAEVYALATRKDQARLCFDPVRLLAAKAPDLKGHVKALRDQIQHPRSGSFFSVMSSAADAMHGTSPHGGFVDELHLHKDRGLIEAVETGTGAREQPLVMYATTADAGTPFSPYAEVREYCEKLARSVLTDPTFYGVVFAAEKGDDPFDPATWLKANPGLAAGDSPTMESMEKAAAKARQNPIELASYLRLRLGIRTKQQTKYIPLEVWDRNAGMVDRAALKGREAYGGLDLAATSDLSALAWVFPDDAAGYDALWRFWTPEANLPRLNERTAGAAEVWVRQGWLTVTPGEVMDYDYIRNDIATDREFFDVRAIAFDPWNSTQCITDLMADDAPMEEMRQGYRSMSPPLKELGRLLRQGTERKPLFRHGGNPVMRWMIDNLAVATDASENVKPDKRNAADKIDGVPAAVMGLDRAWNREVSGPSVYEERGLEVV
ncbi:terminase TerL endonuclease subunit [Streptomyces sp. MP131-18]|uniref:terminase large subunit n=1 Tax=Streptomyces sp. MP131-18 TaxID=1857892 RepID=UPI0009CB8B4D|nr:terminase TerL endonuclease subunit [Streptomyces sp. MP131-18]ONK09446.1 Phage terminase-like protein, large subunit [Streptomyces sp. MP131-18]